MQSLEWRDLNVSSRLLRPSLLLTTGQSFSWHSVGDNHWVGVLGNSVYEIKENKDTTLYRCIHGEANEDSLCDYFDLKHEYAVDMNKISKDVQKIFQERQGVRILQQEPLECLISFICSSNNNISRITRMVGDLKREYGTFLASKHYKDKKMSFYSFPSIAQLKSVDTETLRKMGFGYRAGFIVKTVDILKSRGLDWLYDLRLRDCVTSRNELMSLPGVGRKVADCVLLFGLGKREVVPVDVHIRNISQRLFGIKSGRTLTDAQCEVITDTFKNFAGTDAGWAQAVLFIDSVAK
ncbi:8-oxoguanine DNA-glycosylase, putative [Theileria equi strain WA]|uniref:DNA-(apurinic or apyrimidinic site) lyase n=1 Tax=Theileria equi strain WA TaxID=1537102 RepID=L1LG39_THEEQ|nr:8-oxoguanine DNA-glycosylase, putative [Theileria equi strain WA]EKX74123.1 8-oxoguanine DNA-glycosylase, putative [Theileria equi strain WA]|eukprot:XP_004833575.1 8-oxoguanine DNA-glycosylase, putative [Theileria equi strain WA]